MKTLRKSVAGCKYPIEVLNKLLDGRLNLVKILEIGSGNGFSLCYGLLKGLDITGIEPGAQGFNGRYLRAKELLKINGVDEKRLINATAEELPFEDNTFDAVFSVAVLEHVSDVEKAMSESLRVLKPSGILWANCPNYSSFYEGHYNLPWIPNMSKENAKKYVKLFGRDPDFIDGLNFLTPKMFKGKIYLYGYGLSNYVFVICNYLRDIPILKYPAYWCTKILEGLGMAIIFDVVIKK
jgi:SAM-dependent methyltransferase